MGRTTPCNFNWSQNRHWDLVYTVVQKNSCLYYIVVLYIKRGMTTPLNTICIKNRRGYCTASTNNGGGIPLPPLLPQPIFHIDCSTDGGYKLERVSNASFEFAYNEQNLVQHTDFNGWVENTYRAYVQYSSPVVLSTWYFPMSSYTLEYWYYYSGSTNGSFGYTVLVYANNDNINYLLRQSQL